MDNEIEKWYIDKESKRIIKELEEIKEEEKLREELIERKYWREKLLEKYPWQGVLLTFFLTVIMGIWIVLSKNFGWAMFKLIFGIIFIVITSLKLDNYLIKKIGFAFLVSF